MPVSLADIIIVASAAEAGRLRQFIKAGGGAWSAEKPLEMGSLKEVDAYMAENQATIMLVLIEPEAVGDTLKPWLNKVLNNVRIQPLVIVDAPEVVESMHMAGVPHTWPQKALTPQMLTDALRVAFEWQHIKARVFDLQQQQEVAETRFQDMADLCADWLWEVDENLNITFSSSRKRPSAAAVRGSVFTAAFLADEKVRIEDDFAESTRNPRPFYDRDYWAADAYGGRMCWSVSGMPLVAGKNRVVGFRGIARDISSQKAATDQLYHLANNDPLTGVVNRQRAQEEITRTLRAAKREQRSGALVLLDIDRFTYVNQTHGHSVGDKLLIHLAQVLKDNVRTGDVVARLDGDQFALLLRDVKPDDVAGRTDRLHELIAARPLAIEGGGISLNVSGGIAIYPNDATEPDQLLAHAHDALNKAKERGPHKFERYDPNASTTKSAEGHLEWVELLNECLDEHERRIILYYQPIVPLSGPAVRQDAEHYEVLLRILDREDNLIVPGKFMATAEDFGLIGKIDKLVTLRAIEMLRLWRKQGRNVHLSVNLSGKTFDDGEYLASVKDAMISAKLEPKSLILEITETALLRDLQIVKAFMAELKHLGAAFALDDCGMGYSSFNYIRQLDLDFIKIDGSFIRNLHLNSDDHAFVKALSDIARQKNISTVAEMVEHAEAAEALKTLGIDFGQGYYFAEPQAQLQSSGWGAQFKGKGAKG